MSNVRDCKHGQLARSCDLCECEQAERERDEAVAALRRITDHTTKGLGEIVRIAQDALAKIDKEQA